MSSLKLFNVFSKRIFPSIEYLPILSSRNMTSTFISNAQLSPDEITKEKFKLSNVKSSLLDEKSITLDNDPDRFGTLSADSLMKKKMEEIEEDGDEEVFNYIDGQEGKFYRQPHFYATKIKALLNEQKLAEALNVLNNQMLVEERGKPNIYIFNLLISGCAQKGYTKKAFQLFNQMKRRGLQPKQSTYTSLFNACAEGPFRVDCLKKARYLRELMLEKGLEPNLANYHAMIKAFGRHGDIETSFSIVDEMVSKNIPLTDATFNFLLQATASDKSMGFRHAVLVWRKMLEKKIAPTIFTFNILLRCVRDCNMGDIHTSQELISLLCSNKDKPNLIEDVSSKSLHDSSFSLLSNTRLPPVTENKLVAVTSSVDKSWHRMMILGDVEGLYIIMDSFKVAPNIKTFTQLLEIIPSSTEIEEKLMSEMKKRKVVFDVDFFNILIKKRNFDYRPKEAVAVLDLISKEKLVPNIVTFGVLALGYKTLMTAKQLIKDIEDFGYRPNIQILGTLMKNAYIMRDVDLALYIVDILKKDEIRPNPSFTVKLSALLDALEYCLDLKAKGKKYPKTIDVPNFEEKCTVLESNAEQLKTKVYDISKIHPWEQFQSHS